MRITGFVLADEDVSAPGPSVKPWPAYPATAAAWLPRRTSPRTSFCAGGDGRIRIYVLKAGASLRRGDTLVFLTIYR